MKRGNGHGRGRRRLGSKVRRAMRARNQGRRVRRLSATSNKRARDRGARMRGDK